VRAPPGGSAPPDASPPAGSTLRRNKSSGKNRNPAVAVRPSATAGPAQPGDDENGTNSTVASVFVVEAAERVVDDRHTDGPSAKAMAPSTMPARPYVIPTHLPAL
jgi:hypothetical protein